MYILYINVNKKVYKYSINIFFIFFFLQLLDLGEQYVKGKYKTGKCIKFYN